MRRGASIKDIGRPRGRIAANTSADAFAVVRAPQVANAHLEFINPIRAAADS
jgi:hypothetical protein